MGTNRRYAHRVNEQMNRRITEMQIQPKPVSLSPEEIDVENDPATKASKPIPIRAWVRYPETVVRIEGKAVEWTSRAVRIEWINANGETRSTWVWASSVDRI